MKNFKKWSFTAVLLMMVSVVFSQGKITGSVVDSDLKGSLPGATVSVKGTKTAAATDMDGKFTLNVTTASGQLVISYVGFDSKTINFSVSGGKTVDLGAVVLTSNANSLDEVVVKSTVVDVAKDRKTPVAVSTIKASEIQAKLGNQEFPEILANTPSVYATKSGGGFGDSRINIRGFDQKNIAVMINGVPVNDMENSSVYWSNWAGLSDVTSAMQVQRGLGSSKLAISSVGGTINVVTRTADMKEGGNVSVGLANDNYLKTLATYSTGKMKNGLSTSILLSQTRGDGYVDGTKFEAANYFVGLGYEFNSKSDIQFTITGAPQWHNQRSTAPTIAQYQLYGGGEVNRRYNNDWGTLNGEEYSFRTNYYHKPIASLNWDYKFNSTTKLSAVAYGSWGRGGGSNGAGAMRGNRFFSDNLRRADGTINVDLIQAWNSGQTVTIPGTTGTSTRGLIGGAYQNSGSTSNNLTNGISKIASVNSHNWYGGVINLNKKLTDKLTLDFGLDARTYRGIHYQVLTDLLGADNYKDTSNVNDPSRVLSFVYAAEPNLNPFFSLDYQQQKINYNNDGLVNWYGAFTQLEYASENLTAFIQGAVSQQGFKREDYFLYASSNALASTDYENILGGNVKGGANYNINENHNVFVNAGYYSKQPFFNAVYPNNQSLVNQKLTNEKILGFEAGYGFRSAKFNANVNVYHTTWTDRNQRNNDNSTSNPGGYFDIAGISEIHSGVELDFNAKATDKLKVNGMVSFGNWVYDGNVTSIRYDQTNQPLSGSVPTTLYLDGVKVGDAAQTTASLGLSYEILKRFNVDANYRWSDKLYTTIVPVNSNGSLNFTAPIDTAPAVGSPVNRGSLELPSFGLMDAGVSYKWLLGKDKSKSLDFRLNMNNVLDETYIADGRSNVFTGMARNEFASGVSGDNAYNTYVAQGDYNGVHKSNQVFFGFGRTWNFTMRYNF